MPMDVCHVWLGKPWQFDRKAMHDGKDNTYTFVKDGIKHTLVPMQEQRGNNNISASSNKIRLVSGKEFIHVVKEERRSYALVLKPKVILSSTKLEELSKEIQGVLEEYKVIVKVELPNELSPMRSITHHMDLISNKVAYRMKRFR